MRKRNCSEFDVVDRKTTTMCRGSTPDPGEFPSTRGGSLTDDHSGTAVLSHRTIEIELPIVLHPRAASCAESILSGDRYACPRRVGRLVACRADGLENVSDDLADRRLDPRAQTMKRHDSFRFRSPQLKPNTTKFRGCVQQPAQPPTEIQVVGGRVVCP
jgi:hypothetical protein